MDSKYVRKTIDNLLAELERNPAIGRRPSPSFMSRYGRPLGLGIALGVGGVAGCGGSSQESKNPDALPAVKDALPNNPDMYGIAWADAAVDTRDAQSPLFDVYVQPLDTGPVDAYGIRADALDVRYATPPDAGDARTADVLADTRDALPPPRDAYGLAGPDVRFDTREAMPPIGDAYGIALLDAPLDTRDAPPPADAGSDTSPGDAD